MIIIYIAAKPGQGQSAVDVLEGTKQCGGGAARITKQVVLVWGGYLGNVRWSCSCHDMVHTATGVVSGLVASLFWGFLGLGMATKHTLEQGLVKQTNQTKTSQSPSHDTLA